MAENTYFPIQQTPACPLKWNWSTVWCTQGVSSSCFRNKKLDIDINNFDEFHNHPEKIKEREIMLSGKWPTKENGGSGFCTYCKNIEDAGGTSDRMHMKTMPNQVPKELLADNKATRVTPRIFELFVKSTCNLMCTYCNTRDSSKIRAEVRKHGEITFPDGSKPNRMYNFQDHPDTMKYFEKSLDYLKRKGNELKRFHVLGGEPFLMKEMKQIYETIRTIKNRNLEFNVITNLMTDNVEEHIEIAEKLLRDHNIGRFDLTCSIDNWGPEAEYARTGLNCDKWLKNFDYVVNKKWIYLNVQSTMTTLTMRTYPELIKILNERRKTRKLHTEHQFVTGRDFMHPQIYGGKFWKEDFQNALNLMPDNDKNDQTLKAYWYGMWKSIKDLDLDRDQIDKGKFYLDTLDKRRNLNWRKVYPYLDI